MAIKGLTAKEGYVIGHLSSAWSHYVQIHDEVYNGEHDALLWHITQAKILMMARPVVRQNKLDLMNGRDDG